MISHKRFLKSGKTLKFRRQWSNGYDNGPPSRLSGFESRLTHMLHFEEIKSKIKGYEITKHFKRDLKGSALPSVMDIINSEDYCEELHKFEFKKEGKLYFRAKIKGIHILYCYESGKIVFLRAFRDFNKYRKFLEEVS